MRKTVAALAGLGLTVVLSACGPYQDPCLQLPPASEAAKTAAREGYEVEKEPRDGVECIVNPTTGVLEREMDS